jgi:AAA+ superfamily predicted ATPase
MHYNTTDLEGQQLMNEIANSEKQEGKVLKFFMENPEQSYAPHQIKAYVLPHCPITSSRRAITNLTKIYKFLVKTSNKVIGDCGKPVYTWRLRSHLDLGQ